MILQWTAGAIYQHQAYMGKGFWATWVTSTPFVAPVTVVRVVAVMLNQIKAVKTRLNDILRLSVRP